MQVEDLEKPSFFVYDLEFIGDVKRPETCLIWDIAVHCVRTGETFRAVIDPDPTAMSFPVPPVPECMQLTRGFLNRHYAKPLYFILPKLFRWMSNRILNVAVMISHNNFKSDKCVLEYECARHGIVFPSFLMFFDSLLYFRDAYPDMGEYGLSHLVRIFLNRQSGISHRAYDDTMDLHDVLTLATNRYTDVHGEVLQAYSTSLRCVRGIGKAVQKRFFDAGLYTLEMVRDRMNTMYAFCSHYNMDQDYMVRNWLRTILGDLPLRCHINVHRSITA